MAKKSAKIAKSTKAALKYWAVLASGQTRITSKKVATAKDACLETVGMANKEMLAKPLSTRIADIRNRKWLRAKISEDAGWETPAIKSKLGTDYS